MQPCVYGEHRSICVLSKNGVTSILAFDKDKHKVKLDKHVKKELLRLYEDSKFKGYDIVLLGDETTTKDNIPILVLDDILLKNEYERMMPSKKYATRYENLVLRFLNNKTSRIRIVASYQFNESNLDVFINQFVKTNTIDKITYHKNVPLDYCDDEIISESIWETEEGKIVGYDVGTGSKKEFDEQQNLTSETPYDYLKSLKIVSSDGINVLNIELSNYNENDKINMLYSVNDYMQKKCIIKKYSILDKTGYLFDRVIS